MDYDSCIHHHQAHLTVNILVHAQPYLLLVIQLRCLMDAICVITSLCLFILEYHGR